jgi:hypothetical protein
MATVKKIKKAQRGGCLSTTGASTRIKMYKQAAGEGSSDRMYRKEARQAARAERQEARAEKKAAKAAPAKYGKAVKKAQSGTKMTKAAQNKRTDDMAKSLDKASVFGKNYIAPSDSVSKARPKGMNFDKKSFDKLPSLDKLKKKSAPKKEMKYGGKAKKMMSGGKCKYGC